MLADRLAGPEAAAVEAHIETCAACQQALEELTGTPGGRPVPEPGGRDGSGGDFLRRLEQAPPTVAASARGADGDAAAVPPRSGGAATHALGIVHRDLKPGNVLLDDEGRLKITDFGLAKRLDQQGQTQSGAVVGTPAYMAPEQAAGRSKEVGPAADVYALGAILYEMLTGRPPFQAPTALETMVQVMDAEPAAVRLLQPQVPRDLETVCHKCLHKDPARRYASAQELADDLGRFLRDEPVRARAVGRLERLRKWARRKPAVAALAAALVLVLGLSVPALAVLWASAEERRLQAEAAARQAQAAEAEAEQRRQDAQHEAGRAREAEARAGEERERARDNLYVAHVNLAQQYWGQKDVAGMLDVLRAEEPGPAGGTDRRGFEWHYL